jgi:hypothetical protein
VGAVFKSAGQKVFSTATQRSIGPLRSLGAVATEDLVS